MEDWAGSVGVEGDEKKVKAFVDDLKKQARNVGGESEDERAYI
jgi:hypothetical protein